MGWALLNKLQSALVLVICKSNENNKNSKDPNKENIWKEKGVGINEANA